jgi:hypothetical protein
LIAVALFAALAYAVTQSGRGSGNAGVEQAELVAARILQRAAEIQAAYTRLVLINHCTMDSLDKDNFKGNPADYPGACNIFDRDNGGGATYKMVPDGDASIYGAYTNPPWPGKMDDFINSMDVYGIGTTLSDPLYFIFNIRPDICKAINRREGIVTADGEPPQEDSPYEGDWFNPYDTSLRTGNYGLTIGSSDPPAGANEMYGHMSGCFRASRAGADMGYHFYTVLEVR